MNRRVLLPVFFLVALVVTPPAVVVVVMNRPNNNTRWPRHLLRRHHYFHHSVTTTTTTTAAAAAAVISRPHLSHSSSSSLSSSPRLVVGHSPTASMTNRQRYSSPLPPPAQRCILYDRPPRTGSSTISNALYACMQHKRYTNQMSSSPLHRTGMITSMLNNSHPRRACVKGHLSMSVDDEWMLNRVCRGVLYVTSIATMSARLMSMLKYGLFSGHGNKTIEVQLRSPKTRVNRTDRSRRMGLKEIDKRKERNEEEQQQQQNIIDKKLVRNAKRNIDRIRTQERFLEHYPYNNDELDDDDDDDDDGEEKHQHRLKPHYIIRQEHLQGDVQALLHALGCGHIALRSYNVHTLVLKHKSNEDGNQGSRGSEDLVGLQDYVTKQMQYGNKRFQQLSRLAAVRNRQGLRLARTF